MQSVRWAFLAFSFVACCSGGLGLTHGAITTSGQVDPSDPATWTSSTTAYIGKTDEGSVTLDAGSTIVWDVNYLGFEETASGHLTASGRDTEWGDGDIYVGYRGNGTVSILNSARGDSDYSYIGYASGSTGHVAVTGTDSWWVTWDLYVGKEGNGTLHITNGNVYGRSTYLGYDPGSTGEVIVTGADANWGHEYNSSLVVGNYGMGRLTVADGAYAGIHYMHIGKQSGSTGEVTVTGNDSRLTCYTSLHVGGDGNGILSIADGGLVTVPGWTYVGYGAASNGLLDFGTGGGTLTTEILVALPTQMTGTGTINTQGLISDIDLTFDSVSGADPTLRFNNGVDRDVTIHLDTGGGSLGAGWRDQGSLTICEGVAVSSRRGYLGYGAGSIGNASVSGADSKWQAIGFSVGYKGSGTLAITDSGAVTVTTYEMYIGQEVGSTGEVIVSGFGSTLTFSDADLYVGFTGEGVLSVFDGGYIDTGYKNAYIGCEFGSLGKVIVDGAGSTWANSRTVNVGDSSTGMLVITNGGTVYDRYGNVGVYSGGVGPHLGIGDVIVSGAGSAWVNSHGLVIGGYSKGTLTIANGGNVMSMSAVLGANGKVNGSNVSSGIVTVVDNGSTWNNSGELLVGDEGVGRLGIALGGAITAGSISINSESLVSIDVGTNSRLTVGEGSGTFTNNGTVRLVAGAAAPAGATFDSPILAGSWDGAGAHEAVGGTWGGTDQIFTVSEVAQGGNEERITIDAAEIQRVLISDEVTGWKLGVSLLPKEESTTMVVRARALIESLQTSLEAHLEPGDEILGGWQIVCAYGFNPAYLSFDLGASYRPEDVTVWEYASGKWKEYEAWDLVCDGGYTSFSVNGFSGGFAVTAVPVPEPGSVALLVGLAACLTWRRRRAGRVLV
ncbi:MAG: PEP-CTERM sorting domain-containing protein [Pirellulales bacterium]|nr:PEP-CTERM sorting domain-containing protein [Pirellulales bacterium]